MLTVVLNIFQFQIQKSLTATKQKRAPQFYKHCPEDDSSFFSYNWINSLIMPRYLLNVIIVDKSGNEKKVFDMLCDT